jgi:deoxyribonuclease V
MVRICAFDVHIVNNVGKGALVFYNTVSKKVVHKLTNVLPCTEPYVPGFLAKRELPYFMELYKLIPYRPDYIFVDGNGRLHPEKNGLACQIAKYSEGVPVIGISKNMFMFQGITINENDIHYQEEVVGRMLSVNSKNPVYVSVGGGDITLNQAYELVKSCSKFRIPEPIRHADYLSRSK